jgi:hypothetical protein
LWRPGNGQHCCCRRGSRDAKGSISRNPCATGQCKWPLRARLRAGVLDFAQEKLPTRHERKSPGRHCGWACRLADRIAGGTRDRLALVGPHLRSDRARDCTFNRRTQAIRQNGRRVESSCQYLLRSASRHYPQQFQSRERKPPVALTAGLTLYRKMRSRSGLRIPVRRAMVTCRVGISIRHRNSGRPAIDEQISTHDGRSFVPPSFFARTAIHTSDRSASFGQVPPIKALATWSLSASWTIVGSNHRLESQTVRAASQARLRRRLDTLIIR